MEKFSPKAAYHGPDQIYLVIVDNIPFGYVPISKGSDVFNKLLCDRKTQLENELGHSIIENAKMDDKGNCTVQLESPTRSVIWGGVRLRSTLELKKINIITTPRTQVNG